MISVLGLKNQMQYYRSDKQQNQRVFRAYFFSSEQLDTKDRRKENTKKIEIIVLFGKLIDYI